MSSRLPKAASTRGSTQSSSLARYDTWTSPFLERQTPYTLWEAGKMAVLLPFALVRLVLGLLAVLLLAGMSFVAIYRWPLEKPLSAERRRIVLLSRHCAGFILLMLGFQIKITGWKNVEEARRARALGIFNHSSWVDTIVLLWLFAPSGVSRASNAAIPIVGTCISSFQNIYIPDERLVRGEAAGTSAAAGSLNGQRTGGASDGVKAEARPFSEVIRERVTDSRFPMLFMAPEGTCGDNRCILQFRKGAFVPGIPILPLVFKYRFRHHNPSWTIINEGWEFVRLMCQVYNRLDITILPPYLPSKVEAQNPEFFAKNVREIMAAVHGLPLVEQSHTEYKTLERSGVRMSWDGRRMLAPEGLLQEGRYVDLRPYLKKPH